MVVRSDYSLIDTGHVIDTDIRIMEECDETPGDSFPGSGALPDHL